MSKGCLVRHAIKREKNMMGRKKKLCLNKDKLKILPSWKLITMKK